MIARRFFHVCAGLFLLALSYHLGARQAVGQAMPDIQGVNWPDALTAVVDGVYFHFDPNTGQRYGVIPVPVGGRVLESSPGGGLVYENGDVYQYQGSPGSWVLLGNLANGPTPVQTESWGAMKSRYRGERGAARPVPQER